MPKQGKPRPKHEKPKLSQEERNELRAAGKCFACKELGHTVKDCSTRNTAKPTGLYSSAIQYDLIDQLRKEREKSYINVASIHPDPKDTSTAPHGRLAYTPVDLSLKEVLDTISPYAQAAVTKDEKLQPENERQLSQSSHEDLAYCCMKAISEEDEEKWEADGWTTSDSEDEFNTVAGPSSIQLNAIQPSNRKKAQHAAHIVERNAAKPKDITRKLPKPLVVEATINGSQVRALIDTGSLGDFISTTVVDQLKIKREELAKPIGLQMAVTGSRSSINYSVIAKLGYQGIDCMRRFDVINIDNYDLILGTPFLYQHKVILSLNPPTVSIGSKIAQPISGDTTTVIESLAAELYSKKIEELREILRKYGSDLCKTMAETPLPPLRAINHTIPLIDETKRYHSRRVQCPKPLQDLWEDKFEAYRSTGRWEYRPGSNAIPMLLLQKKSKDGKTALRTVLDKREINANTHKLASPLPDINEILMEVSRHPYRSLIDGKDAYEQIRIIPEHVNRSLFMTPNGTMISHVMQQGDCNAGATYQALMNHIFAEYIGKFMYVYLDDIIIFSDTVEEHEKHVKLVFDVLRREKLYLSPNKMQLFADRLQILGHIITQEGISMDPHKVDAIEKWKAPTTKDQLMSFLGAVGYLAPNCPGIRIPMGVLSKRASVSQEWRWEATEQRAFDEVKKIVCEYREHNRVALDYSPGAPPINLTTDACCTGASGVVSQGSNLKTAKIAAFWSGKFTATQQNYPVHEQELLAIKESLERFKNLLQGVKVRVFTDHKALEFFLTQKKLSPRQTRWMEKINEFDIEVKYIPGETNVLADALSRIYSNEPEGVVRTSSEYVGDTDDSDRYILVGSLSSVNRTVTGNVTVPLYVGEGIKAELENRKPQVELPEAPRRSQRARKAVAKYLNQPQRKRRTAKTAKPGIESTSESPKPIKKDQSNAPEAEPAPEVIPDPTTMSEKPGTILAQCITEFELPRSLIGRYYEDKSFKNILDEPDRYRNYKVVNGALYLQKEDSWLLCIPDIKIGKRSAREVIISHAHSILAHLGARKTLEWMRTQVWWKTMVQDVIDYCKSCHTCAAHKSSTQSPMGLLHAMPMPSYPWQSIGIDFVGPLPESETRYGKFDMIMTVIDNLTRMVHLIPTKQTYKAKDIAEVIFEHVYKLHGMPERIVSDRDSLFTSIFWTRLAELTKTELRMSSAYHPQTDGMTERAQRTYTSLLRMCAGSKQNEWASQLAAIEFAINSARSEATGLSPFYLNYGRTPSPMIHETNTKFPGVREHIERIKLAIMTAHDAILDARVKMTRQANQHRRPADFQIGDLVYVSTKNIRMPKGFARKLAPKFVGPYRIARVITPGASYEVELPKDLRARGIHPVFHASLLRIHVPVDDRRFPGREYHQIVGLGDSPQEWAVDRITSHKGKGRKAIFELLWKTGDRTWEPYRTVRHLEALDAYCEAQGVKNASTLPAQLTEEAHESEPEGMELLQAGLKNKGEKLEKKEQKDPKTAHSHRTRTTASDIPIHSLAYNMSSGNNTQQILETALESQRKTQAENNNMLLQVVQLLSGKNEGKGKNKKRTHRQRNAIAAKHASSDPKNRYYGKKNGAKGKGSAYMAAQGPSSSVNTSSEATGWADINFGAVYSTGTGLNMLTGQGDDIYATTPPIPSTVYTTVVPPAQTTPIPTPPVKSSPDQTPNPATSQSTELNQVKSVTTTTTLLNNSNTGPNATMPQAVLPNQNPPAPVQTHQEEEEVDYEEDYSMDITEGGAAGNN